MYKNQNEGFFPGTWWMTENYHQWQYCPGTQDFISFHWVVRTCVGICSQPLQKSPLPLVLPPLRLILVPVQTSASPANHFHFCWGNYSTLLYNVEKRKKLRSSDTKSLGFGRSVICQDQQNHKMPTCLRGALGHKWGRNKKESEREEKKKERQGDEDRNSVV